MSSNVSPDISAKTTPQRRPVPALMTLTNATRPRRPAGARTATAVDAFSSYAAAVTLLQPLGLSQPLRADQLDDLRALADEIRAIIEALVDNRRPPGCPTLNRFSAQATATQTLRIGAQGALSVDVRWQAAGALAELACQIVTEFSGLDPARLHYCAREACDLLFYDTTRSRSQRWHSESPCGLRERQDRWRKMADPGAVIA
ncbi:CGNR zinc finger domain-containing protein [Streptomyces polygonati]|uniref:CGNR zinc finger domain-containing protein n=1 Tax=Streptomyces polygonati TaxID=1617087 RepID=A0ABV8HKN3_9ACTN